MMNEEELRAVTAKLQACSYCRGDDHTESNCPTGRQCYVCLRRDHVAWQCVRNPVKNSPAYTAGVRCKTCGQEGHRTVECKSHGGAAHGKPGTRPRKEVALSKPLILRTSKEGTRLYAEERALSRGDFSRFANQQHFQELKQSKDSFTVTYAGKWDSFDRSAATTNARMPPTGFTTPSNKPYVPLGGEIQDTANVMAQAAMVGMGVSVGAHRRFMSLSDPTGGSGANHNNESPHHHQSTAPPPNTAGGDGAVAAGGAPPDEDERPRTALKHTLSARSGTSSGGGTTTADGGGGGVVPQPPTRPRQRRRSRIMNPVDAMPPDLHMLDHVEALRVILDAPRPEQGEERRRQIATARTKALVHVRRESVNFAPPPSSTPTPSTPGSGSGSGTPRSNSARGQLPHAVRGGAPLPRDGVRYRYATARGHQNTNTLYHDFPGTQLAGSHDRILRAKAQELDEVKESAYALQANSLEEKLPVVTMLGPQAYDDSPTPSPRKGPQPSGSGLASPSPRRQHSPASTKYPWHILRYVGDAIRGNSPGSGNSPPNDNDLSADPSVTLCGVTSRTLDHSFMSRDPSSGVFEATTNNATTNANPSLTAVPDSAICNWGLFEVEHYVSEKKLQELQKKARDRRRQLQKQNSGGIDVADGGSEGESDVDYQNENVKLTTCADPRRFIQVRFLSAALRKQQELEEALADRVRRRDALVMNDENLQILTDRIFLSAEHVKYYRGVANPSATHAATRGTEAEKKKALELQRTANANLWHALYENKTRQEDSIAFYTEVVGQLRRMRAPRCADTHLLVTELRQELLSDQPVNLATLRSALLRVRNIMCHGTAPTPMPHHGGQVQVMAPSRESPVPSVAWSTEAARFRQFLELMMEAWECGFRPVLEPPTPERSKSANANGPGSPASGRRRGNSRVTPKNAPHLMLPTQQSMRHLSDASPSPSSGSIVSPMSGRATPRANTSLMLNV
eukprot:PhM_4_TR12949/c0_g8_i1/m.5636